MEEIVIMIGALLFLMFIVLVYVGVFDGKTVDEQKKEYLKKYGYPEETVRFGDSQGRLGWIIGKEVLRKIINNPTMKRIRKEIDEQGYSCPEKW